MILSRAVPLALVNQVDQLQTRSDSAESRRTLIKSTTDMPSCHHCASLALLLVSTSSTLASPLRAKRGGVAHGELSHPLPRLRLTAHARPGDASLNPFVPCKYSTSHLLTHLISQHGNSLRTISSTVKVRSNYRRFYRWILRSPLWSHRLRRCNRTRWMVSRSSQASSTSRSNRRSDVGHVPQERQWGEKVAG